VHLGVPRSTRRDVGAARVRELLELVQLSASSRMRPRQVSGGMAQRASLARALARNPGVLLLDEPFGALDALTRLRMQDLLLDIHASEPATVLLVTHDVDEALYLADRVVLLGEEPGYPAGSGATIRRIVTVPGRRPRDRGDAGLAHLRAELLVGLGVSTHHPAHTF
jgi:sulfonate transport system ATP-binding protein